MNRIVRFFVERKVRAAVAGWFESALGRPLTKKEKGMLKTLLISVLGKSWVSTVIGWVLTTLLGAQVDFTDPVTHAVLWGKVATLLAGYALSRVVKDGRVTGVAALALIAILIGAPAMAAAPTHGKLYLPMSLSVADNPGAAAGFGWEAPKSGTVMLLQATYTRTDGVNGAAPFRVGCNTYQVPFSTSSSPQWGVAFTVLPVIRK